MVYINNQTKLNICKEEDKKIIMNIISSYLEVKDEEEVATKTNSTKEIVDIILNNKRQVIKLYNEQVWDKIVEIRKENERKIQEQEYEQLMNDILYLMIKSLYNYNEICEKLYIRHEKFIDMINNEEYIENVFGIQMLEKLRQARTIRRNIVTDDNLGPSTNEIVKDPECRQIIKPNIIKVDKSEHQLIKKAAIFLENNGDSKKAAINSLYPLNDFIIAMNDVRLKDLLRKDIYDNIQNLLEIDCILTQNRISECKNLVKTVILQIHEANGNITAITSKTGYSEAVIRRILEHPYVGIICNSLNISINQDMLYYEEETKADYYPLSHYDKVGKLVEIDEQERTLILNIADYIIENKCSYSKAAEKFNLSKKTICVKMKDKLPHVSKEKSEKVDKIVSSHTSKSVRGDKELRERVLLESKIFLRGCYTIDQVAYLVNNNSYSSTQRDLSQRLPQIDEEKGQLVKTMLQNNQSKNYFKN